MGSAPRVVQLVPSWSNEELLLNCAITLRYDQVSQGVWFHWYVTLCFGSLIVCIKSPLAASELSELRSKLQLANVKEMLRPGEDGFESVRELVEDPENEQKVFDAVSRHPILLQRPIVVHNASNRALIARPPNDLAGFIDEVLGKESKQMS